MDSKLTHKRRITFVTGTRADFGLMARTLRTIASHPTLALQIVATGMHLDRSRGDSLRDLSAGNFTIDATVPWPISPTRSATAAATGHAIAGMFEAFDQLQSDVVLIVGDRVEAFAAAAAGHIAGRCVAHIHGGDRAPGVVDDSLRHSITKLAHVHFPATRRSAERIAKLGEDDWRIHRVGSPGLDGILDDAAEPRTVQNVVGPLKARQYALVAFHPSGADDDTEHERARTLLDVIRAAGFSRTIVVYPNNDPGSAGIVRAWESATQQSSIEHAGFFKHVPRNIWLGLLRDAAVLIGNSSSGIIEAASFGTPVIDVGDRQLGRERGENVLHADGKAESLRIAIDEAWNAGNPIRFAKQNPYGDGHAGKRIGEVLAKVELNDRTLRKLIAY